MCSKIFWKHFILHEHSLAFTNKLHETQSLTPDKSYVFQTETNPLTNESMEFQLNYATAELCRVHTHFASASYAAA